MRKTACPVVWELYRAKSRYGDPIYEKISATFDCLEKAEEETSMWSPLLSASVVNLFFRQGYGDKTVWHAELTELF